MVHLESPGHMSSKVLQFHLLLSRNRARCLPIPSFPSHNELTKRICCYRHTIERSRRKLEGRPGAGGVRQTRQQPCRSGRTRTLLHKLSSCSRAHARKCSRKVSQFSVTERTAVVNGFSVANFRALCASKSINHKGHKVRCCLSAHFQSLRCFRKLMCRPSLGTIQRSQSSPRQRSETVADDILCACALYSSSTDLP